MVIGASLVVHSLALSRWFLAGKALPLRVCGACVACFWVMVFIFQILIFSGFFFLPIVLLVLVPGTFWGWKTSFQEGKEIILFCQSKGSLAKQCFHRSLLAKLVTFIGVFASGLTILRALRAFVAPPLGHDALMYHLVKAGRWVARGNFAIEEAPDHWTYHQWFPYLGDVVFAWAMLPFHGDFLVSISGLLFWLSIPLGCYCLLRQWQCDRLVAVLGALCVSFIPPLFNTMTSGYVDHMAVAISLFCFYFLNEFLRGKDRRCLVVAVAAVALGVGVKVSLLPLAAMVGGVCLVDLLMGWSGPRLGGFVSYFLAGAIVLPMFVINVVYQGNPLYPMGISLGGMDIFKGNQQVADILQNKLIDVTVPSFEEFIGVMFINKSKYVHWPHANLGVGSLFVLPIGLIGGCYYSCRYRGIFKSIWLPMLFALILLASFFSPGYIAQRSGFVNTSGRLLLPTVSVAVLLLATLPRRWACGILMVVTSLHFYYDLPRAFCSFDWMGVIILGGCVLVGGFVYLFTLAMLRVKFFSPSGIYLSFPFVALFLLLGHHIASEYRHDIYSRMRQAEDTAYDFHPIGGANASAYWKVFDGDSPLILAVTSGESNYGHHILRFPFMGSRLQNRVVYIPISKDGSLISYYDDEALRQQTDYDAWHQRLLEAEIDFVVILRPNPIEFDWIYAHQYHYELMTTQQKKKNYRYYRVKRKEELEIVGKPRPEG